MTDEDAPATPVLAPVVIRTSSRRFSGCDMLGGGIAYQGKASPVALPTQGELTMFTTIGRTLRQRAAASLCAAEQRLPPVEAAPCSPQGPERRRDVLGGLLHDYYRDVA